MNIPTHGGNKGQSVGVYLAALIVGLSIWGVIGYIAYHFISKWW